MASDHVHSIRVTTRESLPHLLSAAGLSRGPVLVLVGGAGGLGAADEEELASLIREQVLPVVVRAGATVVDGGTDSGVMRAMGHARAEVGAQFELVGVAAAGTVPAPGDLPGDAATAQIEPRHSHVALVPGDTWGDESSWLSEVASVLSVGHPSVTLLLNGGEIAYTDVEHSIAAGRPVVVVAGSGRTADAIAAADRSDGDTRAARIAASPLVRVVSLESPERISSALAEALGATSAG
jgi:hypothetical protein